MNDRIPSGSCAISGCNHLPLCEFSFVRNRDAGGSIDHIPSGLGAVDRVDSGAGSESVHQVSAVPGEGASVSEATLRDAFAQAALQGLCANPGGPFQANARSGWSMVNCEPIDVADLAYSLADAMLKERTA